MSSGVLYLLFFLLKIISNGVFCELNDNINNNVIIELPLDHEEVLQKTGYNLTKFDADKLKHVGDKHENLVKSTSSYSGLPFTLGQLLSDTNSVDSGEMNPSNVLNFLNEDSTFNAHSSRKQRSDDDIMKQLEHDAIINNILPTMDDPFFRDASYTVPKILQPSIQSPDAIVAYFPPTYGLPIPLYLECKPKIAQGFRQDLLQDSQVPSPYYNRETVWREPITVDEYKK